MAIVFVGIVLPPKARTVRTQATALLEDMPGWVNTVIGDLVSEAPRLDVTSHQWRLE